MRIVITECDHDSFAPEHEVTDPVGAELVLTQSRTATQLVAGALGADAILVQYAQVTAPVMDALPRLRAIGRYGVGWTRSTWMRRPLGGSRCATCPTTA